MSWTSPFAGNSPITGYIVQYWREAENGENKRLREEPVTSSQTTFMLKNLQPGCTYEMNVLALNEVGRGQSSNLVKFKTGEEEPTGAPLDVIAEPKGKAQLNTNNIRILFVCIAQQMYFEKLVITMAAVFVRKHSLHI